MTHTVVHPDTLLSFARAHDLVARDVDVHAAAHRTDVARMAPAFGVLGAEVLAALGYVLGTRADALDALAEDHRRTAVRTQAARAAYRDTDHHAADGVTGSVDLGLRL